MVVILEGKNIDTLEQLHLNIKELLSFPDYYGMNLNALWECLSEGCDPPVKLVWNDFAVSRERLGDDADAVRQVLEEAAAEGVGFSIEFR